MELLLAYLAAAFVLALMFDLVGILGIKVLWVLVRALAVVPGWDEAFAL